MFIVKLMLGGMFGGCWGFAMAKFAGSQDWAMLALTIGLFISVFWLACWIVDCA